MNKIFVLLSILICCLFFSTSCKDFVFEHIERSRDEHPADHPKVPKTGADLFVPPVVEASIPNPDPDGAFADWATCLVMVKEGHSHGEGKLHGNPVYSKAPWKQEQFTVIHNTSDGIQMKMKGESILTHLEIESGKTAPDYFRIIGGTKLWGLCFYFFDKKGKLINDRIYENSDRYQIFFSISDMDNQGRPYEIMDLRYRGEGKPSPVPSGFFSGKTDFEARREQSRNLFRYTYRDTWRQEDMADGVRNLFNLRLLPPLGKNDHYTASDPEDQDFVGLKGHLRFDYSDDDLDWSDEWPLKLTDGRIYRRGTYLLPQFYLAVRVMKCDKGRKALNTPSGNAVSRTICAPFDAPNPDSGWQELIRMNLPINVFTNSRDSDPVQDDPNEPFFIHLAREIGLSPQEAYEASKNIQTHGGGSFGNWFL